MTKLEQMDAAKFYDATLRFLVPSESDPHVSYVVELDSYSGNGECTCTHFECRLRPLLAQQVTADQAVNRRLVKLKPGQRDSDALRCKHIIDARDQLATATIRAISHAEKAHPPQM